MTASTVATLGQYAQALRDVAFGALAGTSGGQPEVAIVSLAEPVFDCCPALYVHLPALREAPTSPLSPSEQQAKRISFGTVILATYVISIIRCAPNPAEGLNVLPSDTVKEGVALEVLEDAWALWNGVRHAIEDDLIFDACLGVHFDGGAPIPESGGCVGWKMTIRADVPGIPHP